MYVLAAGEQSVAHCPKAIVAVLEWVQTASDLIGLAAICGAFLFAAAYWLKGEFGGFHKADRWTSLRHIRLGLGNYILLGLEFMIVSDLIHSFLKPDLQSLGELGVLVGIRTAISFFLGRELQMVEHEA